MDIFSWLFQRAPHKSEICDICRPHFTNSGTSTPETSIPKTYDKIDARILDEAQQAACHGCWIACFAISLIQLTMETKLDARQVKELSLRMQSDKDVPDGMGKTTSKFFMGVLHLNGHRSLDSVEIFKVYQAAEESKVWFEGLFNPAKPYDLPTPLYLERAADRQPISGKTGSDKAFETAMQWLENCLRTHAKCGDDIAPPQLPTRVIDVGMDGPVRLVEPGSKRAPYVCLSHRWPTHTKILRCLQENIEALKEHIPKEALSQNFQEAISFVRRVSAWYNRMHPDREPLRYLWIDSLCIIQDSEEDWERESARMCAIYENATLTVASASGGEGCFSEAERVYQGFKVTNPARPNPTLYLRKELPHYEQPLELFTRGWVLQERLLSRRLLTFAPQELIWECLEGVDCECTVLAEGQKASSEPDAAAVNVCGPADEPEEAQYDIISQYRNPAMYKKNNPNSHVISTPVKIAHQTSLQGRGRHREANLRYWWRRLVVMYSQLHLTVNSDIFPALSGLASQFGQATGQTDGDYVAGCWKSSLLEDLLWIVDPSEKKKEGEQPVDYRQKTWRAPSWSWASVSSQVLYRQHDPSWPEALVETYAHIISTKMVTAGANPLGRLVSASLHVRGPILVGNPNDFDKDLGVEVEYSGDTAARLTDLDGLQAFLLMAKYRGYDREHSDTESTDWCFLHLDQADSAEFRYRRLGLLILSSEQPVATQKVPNLADERMHSCFKTREIQDIELL